MIMMLIVILGTSWALVGAIGRVARNTINEQKQTGESLRLAKTALLGYLAQQALTSDVPGSFPCPEDLGSLGTNNEGTKGSSCSTLPAIGRLPWKTLGIDKPLDGAGEPLWYVIGSGMNAAPINYSTTGSITLDGTANAAVALIIAPGSALNTASSTSTPVAPCTKRDQTTGRNVSPLNSSDYVECGNAALSAFESARSDTWGNDRVIAITSAELLKSIEGAVADRIQRVVAPILNGTSSSTLSWYKDVSISEWGTKFFPYPSTWSDPTSNDSCGDNGATEGLLPLASGSVASGTGCSARWVSGTAVKLSGSGSFSGVSCTSNATRLRCQFTYSGRPVVLMTATAANIAMGFRTSPTTANVTFTPASGNTINSLTPSIVAASGNGQVTLQVTMANKGSSGTGRINITHPQDSILLNTSTGSNPDLAWFINNQWNLYTYYAISPAVSANPSGICTSADVTNCLTLTNAESGTGNINDKRITLVLSGQPLAGKSFPSANLVTYYEAQSDQTSTPGDRTFQRGSTTTTFNDRPAVCPFQRQTSGTAVELCN